MAHALTAVVPAVVADNLPASLRQEPVVDQQETPNAAKDTSETAVPDSINLETPTAVHPLDAEQQSVGIHPTDGLTPSMLPSLLQSDSKKKTKNKKGDKRYVRLYRSLGCFTQGLTSSFRQQQPDLDLSGNAENPESATTLPGVLGEESTIDSSPKVVETNSSEPTVSALDNPSMVTGQDEVSTTSVPVREPEPVVESQETEDVAQPLDVLAKEEESLRPEDSSAEIHSLGRSNSKKAGGKDKKKGKKYELLISS